MQGCSGLEPDPPTSHQESAAYLSSYLHVQWHHIDNLKFATVGLSIPLKLANTTNQVFGFLFVCFCFFASKLSKSQLLSIYQHTTGVRSAQKFIWTLQAFASDGTNRQIWWKRLIWMLSLVYSVLGFLFNVAYKVSTSKCDIISQTGIVSKYYSELARGSGRRHSQAVLVGE